ncbi:MAG: 30S ribosomal protein S16 [Chrysiogenales bacterium]|nr:MAG: 30S ribosomal protein S16 [Chrysiogenales bacterium]
MSVKIRLQRTGTKKKPFYRVIAIDGKAKRDGKYIDQIGRYQPIMDGEQLIIDEEKLLHWLGKGAQPTDTILQLLKKKGLWQKHTSRK